MIDGTLSASDMTSGVNIGSISNSQTRTLQYQAQVASAQSFPFGTTTLTDAVTASGSNMNAGISSASVVVTRSGVLGASSVSTGLTNNPLLDSFFIPLVLAIAGVWAFKSGWFGNKHELVANTRLQEKITAIKHKETV